MFTVANPSSQTHILLLHIPLNGGQLSELQAEYVDLIKEKLYILKIYENYKFKI